MSNVEVRYSVYFMKMRERSDTTLRHSAVRYSIFCGSLFKSDPAIEAVDLYKWIHRSTESHIGGSKIQGSAQPPAKKTAGQIEKETDVSYDLHGIRLRAQSVCMRFNLILFVLVVVLEIRIL